MDPISVASGQASSENMSTKDVLLLKKTQDLAKRQMAQLLSTLPPQPSPNLPGMGGRIDLFA